MGEINSQELQVTMTPAQLSAFRSQERTRLAAAEAEHKQQFVYHSDHAGKEIDIDFKTGSLKWLSRLAGQASGEFVLLEKGTLERILKAVSSVEQALLKPHDPKAMAKPEHNTPTAPKRKPGRPKKTMEAAAETASET